MKTFDVGIIGGGPAGSVTALSLARRGYAVALIDKQIFPREKLCGDFVNPINWPIFHELGVAGQILAQEHTAVTQFRITSCSGAAAEASFAAGNGQESFGLGLRRRYLDYVLLTAAAGHGVAVMQGCRVQKLKRDAQGWCLDVGQSAGFESIRTKILIGADGRNSWVAEHLGMANGAGVQGQSVGFQFYLKSRAARGGTIEIHLFPGGYAGLVGLGDGTLNLGFAVEQARLPREHPVEFLRNNCLSRNPYLSDILNHSDQVGAVRSTYPVYFSPRKSYGDGVLLVGDAARVSEPVTGEGMYCAMKSGLLAAQTIHQAFGQGDWTAAGLRDYELQCRRIFRPRRRINALIRWLVYRPALLSPLIRFSARRGRLLDSLVRAVCLP